MLDSYDNSSEEALLRVKELASAEQDRLIAVECDLVRLEETKSCVKQHGPFVGCIHFAGFKAVGESVLLPLHYYYNNIVGTLNLMAVLKENDVNVLVFSSSATVYGEVEKVPIHETDKIGAASPYGRTKVMIEEILTDCVSAPKSDLHVVLLRYFNPVGAHPSGRIGEDPKGIPNNLLPFVSQVALGIRKQVSVYGDDYETPDGTGVRDYIHVQDLARAHVIALQHAIKNKKSGYIVPYNVGTGKGSSVLEAIHAFEKACGHEIPYDITPRRPGDVASAYCDPSKAKHELGFTTELSLEEACCDFWKWQTQNPNGYRKQGEVDGARKAYCFKIL